MMRTALVAALLSFAAGCAREAPVMAVTRVMEAEATPDKLLARGRAFESAADFTRAAQYYSAAMQAGASERSVLPSLIRVLVSAQRYRSAIEVGESALSRHPSDVRLRYVVATLLIAIDEQERALDQLLRVVENDPRNARAHYQAAVIVRDTRQDWVRADFHFRRYLALEPAGPYAEEARANLLQSVP